MWATLMAYALAIMAVTREVVLAVGIIFIRVVLSVLGTGRDASHHSTRCASLWCGRLLALPGCGLRGMHRHEGVCWS